MSRPQCAEIVESSTSPMEMSARDEDVWASSPTGPVFGFKDLTFDPMLCMAIHDKDKKTKIRVGRRCAFAC